LLQVEHIPIDQLKPNPRNPRKNDEAVDAVARSISSFGFNSPVITDADLNVAAGHTRLKAAKQLGMTTVPVIRVPGLVGSKFTGFAIADNRTAEIADWDEQLLARVVAELNLDVDFNLTDLGFSDKELTEILDWNVEEEKNKEDDAPPCPETPVTQRGDLYVLGEHRLLCGDATNRDDVQRLVEDEKIACLLTDPPYGVNYHSRGQKRDEWGGIQNDDLDPESLERLLRAAFGNVASVCRPGATAYVCHALGLAGVRPAFERAFLAAGFHLSATITWVKPPSMGWGDYRHASEPLLYGWIGDGHRKIKDRTQTTVWHIEREGNYRHPTQKPVALLSRALRNSTVRGEIVADIFAGSGSSMIACEQLGRRCFSMELDARYCDVIVQRWEAYTGKTARRIRPDDASAKEVAQHDVQG
jgi:DNA modification methylase